MINFGLIKPVSLESYIEAGLDIPSDLDTQTTEGNLLESYWLNLLGKKQKEVAIRLSQGYDRREIAKELKVSISWIHKTVKDIKIIFINQQSNYITRTQERLYKNLIWLLINTNKFTIDDLINIWDNHPILKEYRKPGNEKIKQWYNEAIWI